MQGCRGRLGRVLLWGVAVVFLLLVGTAVILAFANRNLPTQSQTVAQLSDLEKARLVETTYLRQSLGEQVWPGWADSDIPVVLYNEGYAFLVGYEAPPDGWRRLPNSEVAGGEWQIADDQLAGQAYYAQPLPTSGYIPQSFVLLVGERWAASLTTMEWMEIEMARMFREQMPPPLAAVFPYEWMSQQFIGGSEGYIGALLHESFHAFVGEQWPERLLAAETAVAHEGQFPWSHDDFKAAWQTELDLLVAAVRADSDGETAELAQQFLEQRRQRRQQFGLASALVDYENQREWSEGLAKYVEMEIQRQAALAEDYEPSSGILADPDFDEYAGSARRWSQQVTQIGRMATDDGDARFYYTGMAQAIILDRLLPDWKAQVMDEGLFLEDLVAIALGLEEAVMR